MHGKITVYHQIKTYLCNINSHNPIKRDRDSDIPLSFPYTTAPTEADELLQSLTRQSFKDFEVIIVEDGFFGSLQGRCRTLSEHSGHPLLRQAQLRSRTNAQLRRRTQPGRIPDYTGFRLHPSRRLFAAVKRNCKKPLPMHSADRTVRTSPLPIYRKPSTTP